MASLLYYSTSTIPSAGPSISLAAVGRIFLPSIFLVGVQGDDNLAFNFNSRSASIGPGEGDRRKLEFDPSFFIRERRLG